uniref:Uncharacterized protein n=1 Tax=Desertifilum tharense IPPAS B-1220 TaxID=1781255 RepID=A0ACD5GQ23_9CYAN
MKSNRMFNRLKYLPWRSLIVVALLTVAIATVLDLLLVWPFNLPL